MGKIAVVVAGAVIAALGVLAPIATPAGAGTCDKVWANPGASGVWDQMGVANGTETQWMPAGVPGFSEGVCIPAGNYTVTVAVGDLAAYTVESIVFGDGTFSPQPRLVINTEEALSTTGLFSQNGGRVTTNSVLGADTYNILRGTLEGTGTI